MTKSELIVRDDDILGGTPVFAGTRVPIQALADYLKHGHTIGEFLEHFPSVRREVAEAVLETAIGDLITSK